MKPLKSETKDHDDNKEHVLFVISCQNYEAFPGFRLNHEGYTAYPNEQEVLLSEGCNVILLSVEKDCKIDNKDEAFSEF